MNHTGVTKRGMPVRTTGLVHIYRADGHDVAALSGVDLSVEPGDMVGLLGPSGSSWPAVLAAAAVALVVLLVVGVRVGQGLSRRATLERVREVL